MNAPMFDAETAARVAAAHEAIASGYRALEEALRGVAVVGYMRGDRTEEILRLWSETTLTQGEIAERVGTSRASVMAIIGQKRRAGDPRAAPRALEFYRRMGAAVKPPGPPPAPFPAAETPQEPKDARSPRDVDVRCLPAPAKPAQPRAEKAAPRVDVRDQPREPSAVLGAGAREPARRDHPAPAVVGAAVDSARKAEETAPDHRPPAPSEPFPASLVLIARVREREVIGPNGVLPHLAAGFVRIMERLAIIQEDQMMDEGTLAEIGNFKNGADCGEHLRRMSHALVRIGIDLQNPAKGLWRVRRLDGGAS